MANKFLGLDSVNVLKQYIDEQILATNVDSRITTIQAYTYVKDSEPNPVTPEVLGSDFDSVAMTFVYPTGWNSLAGVIRNIEEGQYDENITDIDTALSVGSIWMSVGVLSGCDTVADEYSKPVKISGQNGVSIRYAFSYDPMSTVENRTDTPAGPNADNPIEYVWIKVGENNWTGPTIWAMYAVPGNDMKFIFKVTNESDEDYNPITPATPSQNHNWSNTIGSLSISKDNQYLWMCSKKVIAGDDGYAIPWSDPVLIGRWGADGTVPDYTYTIYHRGEDSIDAPSVPGIVAPATPVYEENKELSFYLKDGWVDLPSSEENDNAIWWQCTLMVDGRRSIVTEIGSIKRYNAVDGTARPGTYTKILYRWNDSQSTPEMEYDELGNMILNADNWSPLGWYETPDYDKSEDWTGEVNSIKPDASLWAISAIADGVTAEGYPNVGEWSLPYKLSGPRGPLSYDYRVETRYMLGTETAPYMTTNEVPWYETTDELKDLNLDPKFQYIWAKDYVVYYTMKYADEPNEDGSYDIVQADAVPNFVVDEDGNFITHGEYRLSGINGTDGNKKNKLIYSKDSASIDINSFMTNYYVSNSAEDVTYNIQFTVDGFIDGYTAKFANIGTGNVNIVTNNDVPFTASCTTAHEITLSPQECVELVCCNSGNNKLLLVIGKSL